MSPLAPAGLLTRWALFAAVILVLGAAAFRFLVLRRRHVLQAAAAGGFGDALEIRTARLATIGACLGLIASVCRLPLQMSELRDPAEPFMPQLLALGLHTEWGIVWGCQVLLMLVAALAFASAARGARAWTGAAVIAVLLIPTLSLSGHAFGSEHLTTLAVVSDLVHVIAASAWLGAMVVLLASVSLIHRDRHRTSDPADGPARDACAGIVVASYSPLALWSASLIVLTGIVASWLHLGTWAALWQSRYGVTLLVKVSAVALMAGMGALNWKREGPALAQSGDVAPIRRSIRREVILGLLVLLVTAALVVTPEPGSE